MAKDSLSSPNCSTFLAYVVVNSELPAVLALSNHVVGCSLQGPRRLIGLLKQPRQALGWYLGFACIPVILAQREGGGPLLEFSLTFMGVVPG